MAAALWLVLALIAGAWLAVRYRSNGLRIQRPDPPNTSANLPAFGDLNWAYAAQPKYTRVDGLSKTSPPGSPSFGLFDAGRPVEAIKLGNYTFVNSGHDLSEDEPPDADTLVKCGGDGDLLSEPETRALLLNVVKKRPLGVFKWQRVFEDSSYRDAHDLALVRKRIKACAIKSAQKHFQDLPPRKLAPLGGFWRGVWPFQNANEAVDNGMIYTFRGLR